MNSQSGKNGRIAFILLLTLAALIAFAFQGSRGLWDPDEGRYTNVALEMMSSGDYMTPHRHHETRHVTKPPVTYWAIAASAAVFGKSEWSFRLPMALAFILTVLLVYRLGSAFTPQRPWLPALIYLCSPITMLATNAITTDTLLACAETSAVVAYVNYRFFGKSIHWLDLMWALFGIAFMIKGPPGLLPLLAIVAWEWRKAGISDLFRPPGLILFVVLGLSWFLWITHLYPELLNYFWGHEVVDRVASTTHDRNSQWYGGFVVYVPTLLLAALPWAILVVWRRLKAPVRIAPGVTSGFLWFWLAIPLLVFFVSKSRLPFYVLPLIVPMSLLLGQSLQDIRIGKKHILFTAIWIFALIGAKAFIAYSPSGQDARSLSAEIAPLLPTRPKELVFIDGKASYGTHFYLGTEIEKISIADLHGLQMPSDAEYDQDLHAELFEPESDRYFLVPANSREAFVRAVTASKMKPRLLGTTKKLAVYDISAADE